MSRAFRKICQFFNRISGHDINARNERGETRLYLAVKAGNLAEVRRLLDKGADPNIQNARGRTPLHAAAYLGETSIYEALLESEGDPRIGDHRGRNALHSAGLTGGYRLREEIIKMTLRLYPDLAHTPDKFGWMPIDFFVMWEKNDVSAQKRREFFAMADNGVRKPGSGKPESGGLSASAA